MGFGKVNVMKRDGSIVSNVFGSKDIVFKIKEL